MNDLQNTSFEKLLAVYRKYFSLHYLNSDIGDKLACIALTCYITNEMRKRGKAITCYEVLLKVGNNFGELEKETFLKFPNIYFLSSIKKYICKIISQIQCLFKNNYFIFNFYF